MKLTETQMQFCAALLLSEAALLVAQEWRAAILVIAPFAVIMAVFHEALFRGINFEIPGIDKKPSMSNYQSIKGVKPIVQGVQEEPPVESAEKTPEKSNTDKTFDSSSGSSSGISGPVEGDSSTTDYTC